MSDNLRITLVVIGIVLMLLVLILVAKKKLPIKYSLFWLISALVIFLVGAVPRFVGIFTEAIGFETSASLVTGIIVGLLLIITLLLTVILAEQKRKIVLLIQEVSILKNNGDIKNGKNK